MGIVKRRSFWRLEFNRLSRQLLSCFPMKDRRSQFAHVHEHVEGSSDDTAIYEWILPANEADRPKLGLTCPLRIS